MSQGKSAPRVSGGIPWWIWIAAILGTLLVAVIVLEEQNPPDGKELIANAFEAAEAREPDVLESNIEQLRKLDGYEDQLQVLDGVRAIFRKRDPRALRILKPYLSHEDISLSRPATVYSAMANERMGNLAGAIELYLANANLDDGSAKAWSLVMEIYYSIGVFGPASEAAEKVLTADPDDQRARELIPTIQHMLGETDAAMTGWKELLATEAGRATTTPEIVNTYLTALVDRNEYKEAFEFLTANASLVSSPALAADILILNGEFDQYDLLRGNGDVDIPNDQIYAEWVEAERILADGDADLAFDMLQETVERFGRHPPLLKRLQTIAIDSGHQEVAAVCGKNLERIHDLRQQKADATRAIGTDISDVEQRLDISKLAQRLGDPLGTEFWISAAAKVAHKQSLEIKKRVYSISPSTRLLIPFKEPVSNRQISADPGSGLNPEPLNANNPVDSPSLDPEPEESAAPPSEDAETESGSETAASDESGPEDETAAEPSSQETPTDE